MNKLLLTVLTATLGLALPAGAKDRQEIEVHIVQGRITVPEEVATTTVEDTALLWRIVQAGYEFSADGIVLESTGKHQCRLTQDRRVFRCNKLRHDRGERYKYMVKVIDVQRGAALEPLDPYIQNN